MKLTVNSADPLLARMLALEAKRMGCLQAATDATLYLVDLDNPDPTVPPPTGAISVGFSSTPEAIAPEVRATLSALCRLPLSVAELDAVLENLLPRVAESFLVLDTRTLLLGGRKIRLSPAEAALFALLYENRDRAVSEAEMTAVLGVNASNSNTPAVYLYRLRRKLGADGRQRIATLRAEGARWVGEVAQSI